MNKIVMALLSLCMIMAFNTTAFAYTNAAGAAITIGDGAGSAPTLVFTPSPSSLMEVLTSATNFAGTAASSKTTGGANGNGIEYGILSTTSIMYQMVQADDGALTSPDDEEGLPGTFVTKGGS